MASMAKSGSVTLHCDECRTELARREILMLATVPPSHCHLAVKQEKEDEAFAKLNKVENSRGGKSAQYCPYKVHCRGPQCGKHVGNITRLASKELICYKIENVYLVHDGEEIRAKKLLKIRERLEKWCGIEVVNVSHSSTLHSMRRPSKPMIYCDTSGLSHTSREIDSLTRQRPRDYQRELFLSVMRGNTLVYLPTGSGKTLVAAMVLSCMKKLNPDKLMVFLVDRIPLVYQQSHYIKAQVPDLRVEKLVGEMEAPQQKAVHKALANQEIDVLVLTHQIFLNFLAEEKNPITRISDISVLVFDEAHHCHGNHLYNQIMEYYRRTQEDRFKPVVLGLSASPAGKATVERTTEKLQDLLHNLSCEVSTPVESEDFAKNVNNPDTLYDTASAMNTSQVLLQRFIQDYIQHLKITYMGNTQALEFPVFSPNFRGMIRRLIDDCHGDKRKIKTLIAGEHIMQMLSIVDVSEVLGYKHAMECLRESISSTIHAVSPKDSALKKMVGTHPTFIGLRSLANSSVEGKFPASDKYNILEGHIKQFVSRVQEDETSRGIIFVNMRKTAYQLCTQIRTILEVKETLNPEAFVGHGQGSYDGMAWVDEQEVLLQNFRAGKTKLLISTNVLEEGLDVPVCNLVIRFEGAATLRALVQSRGRASRRPDSKFVVICNEKQKQEAEYVALKEKNMEEAIRRLMANKKQKLQAEQFGCEAKILSLSFPSNQEANENIFIERFNPRITISVHYMGSLENCQRVINFLENHFEVMSMKNIHPTAMANEGTEQKHLAFELQSNNDKSNKKVRSKEAFIRHVTEQWCSCLTNRDEEPLPVWLQASLPRKRHNVKDSFHSLSPNSMVLGTFANRSHFRYEWPLEPTMKNVQVYFDHSLKMLTIMFTSQGYYKLELRYHELENFLVVDSDIDAGVNKVFLTVKHPPRLFKDVENELGLQEDVNNDFLQDDDEAFFSDSLDESESDSFSTDEEYPDVITNFHERSSHSRQSLDNCIVWERVTDILDSNNAWGQCFTYCFTIPCKESSQLIYLLAAIEKRFDKKAFYCRVKESFGRFSSGNFPSELPFDVLYAAQSVVSLHPVVRGKVSGKFSELLQSKPSNAVCAGLEQLKKALEQDKFCDPDKTLQAFLSQNKPSTPGFQNRLVPGHCALIKRAVITPTRQLMFPPEVMIKNRVLRQYETDDFLCVSIRDEDLSKLSAGRGSLDLLLDGVNRVLDEGLRIAGQRFQFLGSSNSQLRGHSCWFVGPRLRPDNIRKWMGDFSHIKCVASFMARMGQCFSTSIDTVGIKISQGALHGVEEDVKTADQKYCFSDGVGRISKELVTEVVKRIAKPFIPSAFQIRFAGFKGVLAVDPTLAGKQAFFRRSMCKFDSFHRRLEVLQTSRPQVVYLNHQVIMLLSNLGVPDEVFIDLQSKMLDRLAGMLVNERDAVELLGTGAKMGVSYHSLSSAGIPLTTEPFFKSLVVAMYRNHINELLSRARILLPPAEARLMMGVMDEIGVLIPGQVFVQYSAVSTRTDREDQFNINKKLVLRGPVVVTRNPCLHPGDVRQLEAVEAPELSHLVDCVVFPRQGARPHPNEMAGGDLDGDLYFVCWSKSLLPRKPNFPPMDYQAQEKHLQDEPITAAHMTKFVIDYIRSDQLGVIDNAHKALALAYGVGLGG